MNINENPLKSILLSHIKVTSDGNKYSINEYLKKI